MAVSGTAEDGTSDQEPGCRKERELIHADGDHPRRELIEPEAEGEGEAGQPSDESTENKEALGKE